jgi:hypothetical protein
MQAMVFPEFYAELNRQGEVLSVSGIENLQQAVRDSAESLNPQERAQIIGSINQQFNADQLKSTLQQAFVYYSADPVDLESTWENEISNPAFQSGILINTWQLDEISGGTATISVEGVLLSGDSTELQEGMSIDISGDTKQTYTVDLQSGWPTETAGTIVMEGAITMEADSQMPKGMEIPMTIRSEQKSTFTSY